jgi:hypothetical protein
MKGSNHAIDVRKAKATIEKKMAEMVKTETCLQTDSQQ